VPVALAAAVPFTLRALMRETWSVLGRANEKSTTAVTRLWSSSLVPKAASAPGPSSAKAAAKRYPNALPVAIDPGALLADCAMPGPAPVQVA